MSTLLVFWLLSFVTLIGIFLYARNYKGAGVLLPNEIPESFSDFIAIELTRISNHLVRLFHHARPHGERAILQSTIMLKKGHDMFIEKIFGNISIEKGKTASFFLKRIAEHKEALRQKDHEGA